MPPSFCIAARPSVATRHLDVASGLRRSFSYRVASKCTEGSPKSRTYFLPPREASLERMTSTQP
jgi:hypothetical protein